MKIKISTPLFPTEDSEKIKNSLDNIFNTEFKIKKKEIYCESNNIEILSNLKEKILSSRIKNTVAFLIEENKKENSSKFCLNKQTAIAGKIHFVEEEYPLGNITVEFDEAEKIEEFLLI